MAMSHNTLQNYYSTVFSLAQYHKYSISEIENLIPFERDIYVHLLVDYLKKVEEEKTRRNGQ